jgi:tripartite-type tricarboxylate transporter receptor subunit TctC
MSVPTGTPREIITRLHTESVRILALPEVRNRMITEGAEFVADTPEQFTAFLRSEIEKWGRAVKASGARPEG